MSFFSNRAVALDSNSEVHKVHLLLALGEFPGEAMESIHFHLEMVPSKVIIGKRRSHFPNGKDIIDEAPVEEEIVGEGIQKDFFMNGIVEGRIGTTTTTGLLILWPW